MTTSNTYNQGIAHASFTAGGKPLCNANRAIMVWAIADFRKLTHQCKRCAAKLADMDKRAERRSA